MNQEIIKILAKLIRILAPLRNKITVRISRMLVNTFKIFKASS